MNNIRKKKTHEGFHIFVIFFAITGIRTNPDESEVRNVYENEKRKKK